MFDCAINKRYDVERKRGCCWFLFAAFPIFFIVNLAILFNLILIVLTIHLQDFCHFIVHDFITSQQVFTFLTPAHSLRSTKNDIRVRDLATFIDNHLSDPNSVQKSKK